MPIVVKLREIRYRPEVIRYLENYVRTCKNPKEEFMDINGSGWNLLDVVREIKARSETGQEFYKAFASLYDKLPEHEKRRRVS